MEAERDDERKRQRGSVLICWQEGMLEDKQRQSRSAQEAERERKRKEPYWLQSLLPQQPSWTINVWWFTSAKIYTQTGLQGHPRILRKASQDVFRNVQSKATGLPFYLQPKTLSFKSSSKNVNFKMTWITANLYNPSNCWFDSLWLRTVIDSVRQMISFKLSTVTPSNSCIIPLWIIKITKILSDGGLWVKT